MSFHVGQRVQCIATPKRTHYNESVPEKGRAYTVRHLRSWGELGDGVVLQEIINPERHYFNGIYEAYFAVRCFRPLEEKKYSIEIFREITRSVNEGRPLVPDAPEKVHVGESA